MGRSMLRPFFCSATRARIGAMTTTNNIEKVVIVGGGSAGWLTAGVLAATLRRRGLTSVSVTLIESPNIATIGVGEGTWPSMRTTLQSIGISETDFIRHCDAAFKQGTCFVDWLGAGPASAASGADQYLHPFTLPQNYHERNPAADWLSRGQGMRFSDAVTAQGRLAPMGFAPKSISTPEYAFFLNYGYHLDAGRSRDRSPSRVGTVYGMGDPHQRARGYHERARNPQRDLAGYRPGARERLHVR